MIDLSRILTSAGADAQSYEVRRTGGVLHATNGRTFTSIRFTTGSVNGHTPDDSAIGNLADMSEQVIGALVLYSGAPLAWIPIATAESGIITRLRS